MKKKKDNDKKGNSRFILNNDNEEVKNIQNTKFLLY